MGDVISLPIHPEKDDSDMVWGCNQCGETRHYLHDDGSVSCGGCHAVFEDIQHFNPKETDNG